MSEEKPLYQIFYEEAKDIKDKFEEARDKWYFDEIDWSEMEKKAGELFTQFKEIENKYKGRIDWTKLGEKEGYIPSLINTLRLTLGKYVGPGNLELYLEGE